MSKHTPGPWEFASRHGQHGEGDALIQNASGAYVADARVYAGGSVCRKDDEVEANARLIATAPDLLEACKLIRHAHQYGHADPRWGEAWEAMCLAIAKAEGQVTPDPPCWFCGFPIGHAARCPKWESEVELEGPSPEAQAPPSCGCGADACNSPKHAHYCPKHVKEI